MKICLTGLAPLVYLEGVKLGVDQVQTSIAPLANGEAQPATQTVEASYLTGGMNWRADYVLVVDANDVKGDLQGWVTLTSMLSSPTQPSAVVTLTR